MGRTCAIEQQLNDYKCTETSNQRGKLVRERRFSISNRARATQRAGHALKQTKSHNNLVDFH